MLGYYMHKPNIFEHIFKLPMKVHYAMWVLAISYWTVDGF